MTSPDRSVVNRFADGQRVLRDLYELFAPLPNHRGPTGVSEAWEALDDEERPHLVKLWPYDGEQPDEVQRALWDAELRTMYRIGSSPGAADALVTMRDAGVDRAGRCFVMVLQPPGFEDLATVLADGALEDLQDRTPAGRRAVWRMLRRVAKGLRLLHEQHVLHRDVRAENLLLDTRDGLGSVRLGGFEWTVRLGTAAVEAAPVTWSTPPERLSGTGPVRLEDDWFGFGIVAARCLLDLENYARNPPEARLARTRRAVERANARQLSQLERGVIGRLIAGEPRDRLTRAAEVDRLISEIIGALDVVPEEVVHPGLLGGWWLSRPLVPRRTPDEVAR